RWRDCRDDFPDTNTRPHEYTREAMLGGRVFVWSCIRVRRGANLSYRIGIVDTTFSRVNMGQVAVDELRRRAKDADIRRTTVPGVKDLPAAARRFFDDGCDLVIACGMVGAEDVDK